MRIIFILFFFTIHSYSTSAQSLTFEYDAAGNRMLRKATSVMLISVKVFLQGAMSGPAMSTTLNTAGLIPKTQPYTGAPFNYAGVETVGSIPIGVTDWILVEIRNTSNTVLATRAAFVKQNGSVVDLDGTSSVSFPVSASLVSGGSYYIAIRHRNHLSIRSSATSVFNIGSPTSYDFTTAQAQAYQNPTITNPAMKDLGSGSFAMWGGNASANTMINFGVFRTSDRGTILNALGGITTATISGYLPSDVNFTGTVNYGVFATSDRGFVLTHVLKGVTTDFITSHD